MHRHTLASRSKTTFIGIIALFFLSGFSNLACSGSSYSPDETTGTWQGSLKEPPVRVDLEIMSDGANLDYTGSGRDCGAWAVFVSSDDNTSIYSIRAPQGGSLQGWCKKLRDEQMELTLRDQATLDLHLAVENEGIDETIRLSKVE